MLDIKVKQCVCENTNRCGSLGGKEQVRERFLQASLWKPKRVMKCFMIVCMMGENDVCLLKSVSYTDYLTFISIDQSSWTGNTTGETKLKANYSDLFGTKGLAVV